MAMKNSISLRELSQYLDSLYQVQLFKDYCPKGLVVEGTPTICKIITGVSLCEALIQEAIIHKADAIIVHHPHGFWDNQSKVIQGAHKRKIKLLLDHNISVFGFHLPMDAQAELGNNAQLALALGLQKTGSFAKHGGIELGSIGQFDHALSLDELRTRIEEKIGPIPVWIPGGPEKIQTLAWCTGAAPNDVEEIIELGGVDAYLTGEARENTQSLCMENGIHFIAAGHHQTEVFGPRALATHLNSKLGIESIYINIPNPV